MLNCRRRRRRRRLRRRRRGEDGGQIERCTILMNFYVAFHLAEQRKIKNVYAFVSPTSGNDHKIVIISELEAGCRMKRLRSQGCRGANISMRVYAFVWSIKITAEQPIKVKYRNYSTSSPPPKCLFKRKIHFSHSSQKRSQSH